VQDWLLPFYPEITSQDIDDTFRLDPGKKVVFQHIKGKFYVLDPALYCSAPPPDMLYFKNRCYAIYSILKETSARRLGNLADFEFVYDLSDFPSYRSHNKSINHQPMPGFGSVRCWQKGFLSFPMFGSHGRWDINAIDGKIAGILGRRPTPFAERKSTAVFRGGLRSCSFPPEHNDMLDWRLQDFKDFYKGKRCGRDQLQVISQGHPNLVDFRNTDGGAGMQSMEEQEDLFKYIISAEGYGGWADRLFDLLFYDVGLIVQEHPCKEWYEDIFSPFQHYIPVANDFSNLLGRIQWAERHPHAVQDMVRSRIARAKDVLSKEGILTFSTALWTAYADLQKYLITRRGGAVALTDLFL